MPGNKTTFRWQMNTDGSDTYERYIVPTWMTDWTGDLLVAGGVGPGTRVLDAACGTGIVARKAAGHVRPGGRIAALDANEGMLRVAQRCAEEERVPGIGWYKGDVSAMPFCDGDFDVVLCQQGLQFFPDRAAALREMGRVLVPGGRLALSVWGRPEKSPHVPVICDVLGKYFGKDSTTLFRIACSLSDHAVLHDLVAAAGFSGIQIQAGIKTARHPSLAELLPAYFSIFPVATQITAMQEDERNEMFRSLMASLERYTENAGLAVPTENIILTAVNEGQI